MSMVAHTSRSYRRRSAGAQSTVLLPISATSSPDSGIRRATRILAMVHELHKAGYQRLRICSGMSYDKAQWRCLLLPADDVLRDGWTPLRVEHEALYTSNDGNRFFNWDDAAGDGARELAIKFISRFPELARAAEGSDWLYVGWFSNVLGAAENDRLPIFYNGLDDQLPDCTINPPPPPEQPTMDRSSTGVPIILNDDLRHDDLPAIDARYEDQLNFCGSFDGYAWAVRTGMDLLEGADAAERKGLGHCTMTELRLVAFARQRQEKWYDQEPAPDWIFRSISDVIEAIRKRLSE